MSDKLLDQLNAHLETFLQLWTQQMSDAGYLAHTTAKRDDCIESFNGVIESIRKMVPAAEIPTFAPLMRRAQDGACYMLQTAKNHRHRGITAGMFLGCFKTLIHSLEDIVLTLGLKDGEKLEAVLRIRRVCDVLETTFISDWEQSSDHDMTERLQGVNRQLTLKKNRYENIYRSTSDLVILTDDQGLVIEVNPETEKYVSAELLHGKPLCQFLRIDCQDMGQMLTKFTAGESHEVSSLDNQHVFSLRIVPLSRVSLAAQEYMLILSDITLLVNHRQELEQRVAERTADLSHSQNLLQQEKAQTDEMNVTLRNVMKSIESERRDLEQKISCRISTHLLPALEKIRHETAHTNRSSFLDLIQEQLISLTSGFDSELDAGMLKLSKTEIRICNFIQAGCSSKEISEAMNLAFDTVRTHRKNIRTKLGLKGKDVNLHLFLASRNCPPPEKI
ncbi:regulatory protein, luxR family [Desulfuromusa kysingii]|uniref:Regulatory protein, luxR family n=1 Tax=Desulfuromusa kysingii TaxID=37625 RepID=A0A1H4DQU7_9BACT|nr:PAS and helix-turn-helix domain-containing protein [Desulfuromusa kysingii]SEA74898.1 regulatory protein, luxR family [Desulfuromusa kysingii]